MKNKKLYRKIALISTVISIMFFSNSIILCKENKTNDLEDRILLIVSSNDEIEGDSIHKAFDDLDSMKDDAIDLVVKLFDYYLGAAGGELLLEKTTKIGDKVLPYLVEKKIMPLECKKEFSKLCFDNKEERNRLIDTAIDAIKKGIILYAVYPDGLQEVAEKDIEIIKVFIEEYRIKKKYLPSSLEILRNHVWNVYGYKLVIVDPWDKPLQYKKLSSEAYTIKILDDKFERE